MRLTVYLLPDQGPISPVQLDLLDVFGTMTPPRPADGLGHDELRRLGDALRKRFPGVRPESNPDGLARIYANFGHADRFDGVVLRVAGAIDTPPDVRKGDAERAGQVRAIEAELRRRDQRIRELDGVVQRERRARDEREPLVAQLGDRVSRLTRDLAAAREEAAGAARAVAAAQEAAAQVGAQLGAARHDLVRARAHAEQLAQRLQQLEVTLAGKQREIEELRAERRAPDPTEQSHPMLG